MKSSSEKSVIYLTIPSLVGIIMAIVWIFILPHKYLVAGVLGLAIDALCIVGIGTAIKCLFVIKNAKDQEMRVGIAIGCFIINVSWLVYIALCISNPGSFGAQSNLN